MGSFWTTILVNTILQKKKRDKNRYPTTGFSDFQLAKGMRELRIMARHGAMHFVLVVAGIFSAAFGLKSFLFPVQFLDGGATGIALIATEVSGYPLPLLLILVNIPFILLGIRVVNPAFAVKTALAIGGLAFITAFVSFPIVTQDKLLVAVFGGFFLGAGIGLSMRGGAVIDGTEVLAIALSRRLGISIGDVILIFNVLIFSVAAWLLGVEKALYAVLTYMAASKAVDFVVEGIDEYIGVTIVSVKSAHIHYMISQQMGRGATILKSSGGHGQSGSKFEEQEVIFTVITRLELSRLKTELEKIDPKAFVVMLPVNDVKGGLAKKRPFK